MQKLNSTQLKQFFIASKVMSNFTNNTVQTAKYYNSANTEVNRKDTQISSFSIYLKMLMYILKFDESYVFVIQVTMKVSCCYYLSHG